jgi:uncharacterized protein
MSTDTAARIIGWIFESASGGDGVDIGFFGGEPLLEFDLLRDVVDLIERHPRFDRSSVTLSVVTNGTVFTDDIADYLLQHGIVLCLSCDGPPAVQDRFRKYRNGRGSSPAVLKTLDAALERLPLVLVNAVYRPETLEHLPATVEFLSARGVRQIYLNPDVTAPWRPEDAAKLPAIFGELGRWYVAAHLRNDPHFLSLIDSKITVILRGGYQAGERCQMGNREVAFSAEGRIYPCERLIGDGRGGRHCIGSILDGYTPSAAPAFRTEAAAAAQSHCANCGLKDYCMNWCGCSNFLSTGRYDGMSPFLCAAERAAIATAAQAYQCLDPVRPGIFSDHLAGKPSLMSRLRGAAASHDDCTALASPCGAE